MPNRLADQHGSCWRTGVWQFMVMLQYLGLLRARHYIRFTLCLALLISCIWANIWLYGIADRALLNTNAAVGMVGVSQVDSSNYAANNRAFLLWDNAENATAELASMENALVVKGAKSGVLTRCGDSLSCRRGFLKSVHLTLRDFYTQFGRLDSHGRPVRAQCAGGESHALTCAYFLHLLMRPKSTDGDRVLAQPPFKDVGFMRYVSRLAVASEAPPPEDEDERPDQFGPAPTNPVLFAAEKQVPVTPCTRTESQAIFSAVSRFHAALLLTALVAWLLQMNFFPLCSMRSCGFQRLMHMSGFNPCTSWLAAFAWGFAECLIIAGLVAVAYKTQCGSVLEAERISLAFLAVLAASLHFFTCGLLTVALTGRFAHLVPVLLLLHLFSLIGSIVTDFAASPLVRYILAVFLPGSLLNSMLKDAALTVFSGGEDDPLRAHNSLPLVLAFFVCLALALASLYAETARLSAPRGLGCLGNCGYPALRATAACCGCSHGDVADDVEAECLNAADSEAKVEMPDPTWRPIVHAQSLGKTYVGGLGDSQVTALVNFSADIYEGQITALIGPNGSGKSTLMRLLSGDELPTTGKSTVLDVCVTNPYHRLRVAQKIGICYQDNTLCDSLTVWESVVAILASRRADTLDERAKSKDMLNSLGLGGRLLSRMATQLSGGQQRKLCAVLALAGNPELVLLDEPTSGLDPLSRRSLWSLLANNRTDRTILLSTQFMDEADLLADRKLLLRQGRLECAGSSLFIKQQFGCGCSAQVDCDRPEVLVAELRRQFGDSKNKGGVMGVLRSAREVEITAPRRLLADVAKWLETQKASSASGINNFGLGLTGLDAVFQRVDESAATTAVEKAEVAVDSSDSSHPPPPVVNAVAGELNQFNALLTLNLRRLVRDRCRLLCRLVLPCLLLSAFLALLIARAASLPRPPLPPAGIDSRRQLDFSLTAAGASVSGVCLADAGDDIVPPQEKDCDNLLTGGVLNYEKRIRVLRKPPRVDLAAFLRFPEVQREFRHSCQYALQCPFAYANDWNQTLLSANANRTLYYGYYFAESFAAGMSNTEALVNGYVRLAGHFNVTLAHLDPAVNNATAQVVNPTRAAIYVDAPLWAFLILLSVIPVGFLADPVEDRAVGLRSQLKSMGVSALGYWASLSLLHWLQYLIFCLPACLAMAIALPHTYANAYFLLGVFPPLLLFGLPSNLMLVYLTSTLIKRPSALATGLLFLACFACGIAPLLVQFSSYVGLLLCTLCPPYAVVGLPFYAAKAASHAAEYFEVAGVGTVPSMLEIYFSNPLLLVCVCLAPVHALLLAGFLVAREQSVLSVVREALQRCLQATKGGRVYAGQSASRRNVADSVAVEQPINAEDPGVQEERNRLIETRTEEDAGQDSPDSKVDNRVEVIKLAKHYSGASRRPAVSNVTFSAESGQIFGLLGPNGAGKSTTLSVLIGERSATSGECRISGRPGMEAAKNGQIGFCPQYSPLLPNITVLEHLEFYAKVRGIPRKQVRLQANKLMSELGLAVHSNAKAGTLSGGNRRRLCLAIALIGDPSVLVIDEASTGVDPENKRAIWRAVQSITSKKLGGKTVILTTHSMEEAEALCGKVGIMYAGKLLAVGTNQALRSRYGKNYTLDIQLKRTPQVTSSGDPGQVPLVDSAASSVQADTTTDGADCANVSSFLTTIFADTPRLLEDFRSWARYEVKLRERHQALSEALAELEAHPMVESYALYQASLDQIFVSIVSNRAAADAEADNTDVVRAGCFRLEELPRSREPVVAQV